MLVDLYKLYGSYSKKTPKEDFTTEALCSVLSVDPERIDAFVNEVLKIPLSGFTVETQQSYPGSIVDMVFHSKSAETLVFLENKVDSSEGAGQLAKYAERLNKLRCGTEVSVSQVFLGYCTRFVDVKSEKDFAPLPQDHFRSFQWKDVYQFIHTHPLFSDEYVAKSFLEYLEWHGMNRAGDFSLDDLVAMRAFPSTLDKMKELCEALSPEFIRYFGEHESLANRNVIKHLTEHGQYCLTKQGIVSGSTYESEITAYFSLGHDNDPANPTVACFLYLSLEHKAYNEFLAGITTLELSEYIEEDSDGVYLSFEKPLAHFIGVDDQQEVLITWFRDRLSQLHQFMKDTKSAELDWQLPEKCEGE